MKVYKSDVPAEKLAKIATRVNEALDKFQIEKVNFRVGLSLFIFKITCILQ